MDKFFENSERLLSQLTKELAEEKARKQNASAGNSVPLYQLNEIVKSYCKNNSLQKKDLAMLAGISSNTLSSVLKKPENAKVSTIMSIGQVIGVELTLTRT